MTKQEYEQAKIRNTKYEALVYRLQVIEHVLTNNKKYSSLDINSDIAGLSESLTLNSDMRTDLVTLLQNERTRVLAEMEAL